MQAVRIATSLLLDLPRARIQPSDDRQEELRFRALANRDPAEAERLHGAGRSMRRWPPAAPASSRPTPTRIH